MDRSDPFPTHVTAELIDHAWGDALETALTQITTCRNNLSPYRRRIFRLPFTSVYQDQFLRTLRSMRSILDVIAEVENELRGLIPILDHFVGAQAALQEKVAQQTLAITAVQRAMYVENILPGLGDRLFVTNEEVLIWLHTLKTGISGLMREYNNQIGDLEEICDQHSTSIPAHVEIPSRFPLALIRGVASKYVDGDQNIRTQIRMKVSDASTWMPSGFASGEKTAKNHFETWR